jgi:hypothetical protein
MTTIEISADPNFLDRYQDMRWCIHCAGEQIFIPVFECEAGRVGVCLGCGDEHLVPFTRINSEAA